MLKEGIFLGKRYEILDRIGSGGMADVYKGKDHKLNRYVAIKVLKSDFRSDETFIKKFLSESGNKKAVTFMNSRKQLQTSCFFHTILKSATQSVRDRIQYKFRKFF